MHTDVAKLWAFSVCEKARKNESFGYILSMKIYQKCNKKVEVKSAQESGHPGETRDRGSGMKDPPNRRVHRVANRFHSPRFCLLKIRLIFYVFAACVPASPSSGV